MFWELMHAYGCIDLAAAYRRLRRGAIQSTARFWVRPCMPWVSSDPCCAEVPSSELLSLAGYSNMRTWLQQHKGILLTCHSRQHCACP